MDDSRVGKGGSCLLPPAAFLYIITAIIGAQVYASAAVIFRFIWTRVPPVCALYAGAAVAAQRERQTRVSGTISCQPSAGFPVVVVVSALCSFPIRLECPRAMTRQLPLARSASRLSPQVVRRAAFGKAARIPAEQTDQLCTQATCQPMHQTPATVNRLESAPTVSLFLLSFCCRLFSRKMAKAPLPDNGRPSAQFPLSFYARIPICPEFN